ncbi:hypothetical protein K1719_003586 [Acacia pycnantha]|nr:hypothetical protein K1719_003586 [Acacia pycnantha]
MASSQDVSEFSFLSACLRQHKASFHWRNGPKAAYVNTTESMILNLMLPQYKQLMWMLNGYLDGHTKGLLLGHQMNLWRTYSALGKAQFEYFRNKLGIVNLHKPT